MYICTYVCMYVCMYVCAPTLYLDPPIMYIKALFCVILINSILTLDLSTLKKRLLSKASGQIFHINTDILSLNVGCRQVPQKEFFNITSSLRTSADESAPTKTYISALLQKQYWP
jgi:hypothetical protein